MVAVDLDPTIDFVGGTAAGVVGLLVAHPFDTIKTRFQNPSIYSKYKSTLHAFGTIIREERFTGLYKGVVSPLTTCAFMNGLVFSSYKLFMRMQLDDPASVPSLTQVGLAGAGCGIVTSLIASPTELIKIRQQNVLANDRSNVSAHKVAIRIFRRDGIRGLYRGLSATALRDTGYGTYFLTYEATCRYFRTAPAQSLSADHSSLLSEMDSEASRMPWSSLVLAGGMAGIAGWAATFPMDLVKTRMQSTEPQGMDPYRTIASTVQHAYRAEGPGVFFRGLAPTLIRSVPVNVATFSVYEWVVQYLA